MRDLVESALVMVRDRKRGDVRAKAEAAAEDRILDALVGAGAGAATRDSFRKKLRAANWMTRRSRYPWPTTPRRSRGWTSPAAATSVC